MYVCIFVFCFFSCSSNGHLFFFAFCCSRMCSRFVVVVVVCFFPFLLLYVVGLFFLFVWLILVYAELIIPVLFLRWFFTFGLKTCWQFPVGLNRSLVPLHLILLPLLVVASLDTWEFALLLQTVTTQVLCRLAQLWSISWGFSFSIGEMDGGGCCLQSAK